MAKQDTQKSSVDRRGFLGIAWLGSIVALLGQLGAVLYRFIQPVSTGGFGDLVRAGFVDEFPPGSISLIKAGRFYLQRFENGSFLALWQRCTHLGCSVPWDEGAGRYHCPCHGSLFNVEGEVTGGPAPRPLDYFPVVIQNGEVFVDTGNPQQRSQFDPEQTTQA